ncbi:permease protein MsbA [Seminavis robusta]|uniref:Permease protein MsbA n=1 Tax=Seminavis robusta TaxID=568900 RepID=A0A9N8HQ40_9STRA|nr:permease protein MsbA [Seminavis robusta]|eukprot:Sro1245_g255730.1 permease protein MsbA (643) ;mRNA; f:23155-25083
MTAPVKPTTTTIHKSAMGNQRFEDLLHRSIQLLFSFANIVLKWMFGVLLRKLIDASLTSTADTDPDNDALLEPTRPLLNFVFLFNVPFGTVIVIGLVTSLIVALTSALLTSMAVHRAAHKGQSLRKQILQQAVHSASSADGNDIHHIAHDLIVKVNIIERFVEFDEHWIIVNIASIALAMILSLTFAWYGGLVALLCFALSMLVLVGVEHLRKPSVQILQEGSQQVNARLLDVIKNGVKIHIMKQLPHEQQALQSLEHATDVARQRSARLKLIRELVRQYLLTIIPILMILVAWCLIQTILEEEHNAALAIDVGSSILVATLMLDEAHKSFMELAKVQDKQLGADQAQEAIDRFLVGGATTTTTTPTGPSDDNTKEESNKTPGDIESGHDQVTSTGMEGSTMEVDDVDGFDIREESEEATAIELNDISLTYPGRAMPVLDRYSQTFARNQLHALVGESGSGKSTALKIIAGLLQPTSGRIHYWRGMQVAYVSQDQTLFCRSIRDNVTYCASDDDASSISDDEIWEALERANIKDWIASLPQQLDTVLSNGEGGVSGGQLQRLNLAHLFCVCQHADLVILDEVLSALDQTSREKLLDELHTFLQGKTAIIITHHSEMLRICDQVHELRPPSHASLPAQVSYDS